MARFACQRVHIDVERASSRITLALYDVSWIGHIEESTRVGPYLLWGRPIHDAPHAGIIASEAGISISEKGEYQLVAKIHAPLENNFSFWDELTQTGLCKNDPSSLLDPLPRSARLQVHGIVGRLRIIIRQEQRVIASLPLQVMPHKLDYQSDLKLLLEELSTIATSLLLRTKKVATLQTQSHPQSASPLEKLLIFQAILRPSWIPRALAVIAQHPHQEIETTSLLLRRHQWHQALPEQLMQTLASRGSFHPKKKIQPEVLQVGRRQLSFDTPENRFILSLLRRIQQETRRLCTSFARAPEVLPYAKKLATQAASLTPPIPTEDVSDKAPSTASLLLRRRRGYREAWMASRLLGKELAPNDDATIEAPGRTLPVLYENWCLLVLARSLAALAGIQPKLPYPLFLQTDGVLRFKTGVMQVIAPGVSLGYQMQFQTLRASSLQLRPDFLVELYGKRLVFDAKYRLAEDASSPQHEDMMVAHAYKDALQVDASFVLYPGRGDAMIHRQAPPFILPAVGAFPLRPAKPNATGEETLLQFLQECMIEPMQARRAAEQREEYSSQ
jgi:predicted component of viral defense system (DUF524 family)